MSDMHARPASVLTEQRGSVLIITLNRPEAKNAVDPETAAALNEAMDELDNNPDLFIGILTGAGGTFSAGADLKAIQRYRSAGEPIPVPERGGFGLFKTPPAKPLLAAVEGFAFGGGMEACLACDMVIAAEDAQFCLPEVKWNVAAIGGGLFRLASRIPYNIAMEMVLTGKPKDAPFMEMWGFVNRLAAKGAALETALEIAGQMLENGPLAMRASNAIMVQSRNWSTEAEAWEKQLPIYLTAVNSEDTKEGLAAFAQRRRPVWQGR